MLTKKNGKNKSKRKKMCIKNIEEFEAKHKYVVQSSVEKKRWSCGRVIRFFDSYFRSIRIHRPGISRVEQDLIILLFRRFLVTLRWGVHVKQPMLNLLEPHDRGKPIPRPFSKIQISSWYNSILADRSIDHTLAYASK